MGKGAYSQHSWKYRLEDRGQKWGSRCAWTCPQHPSGPHEKTGDLPLHEAI